ncbi:hypothetical protein AN958_02648 [Leucoagaricus sp. SymC.cos]|nr:hypothetical protein AN958_02648 [Leucoagaricus sp. SymC.cos]
MNYVNNELRKQVEALTKVKAGYHFTAQDISVEQIEMCDIEKLSGGMEELAPDVWELLGVLLQADPTVNQKCKIDKDRATRSQFTSNYRQLTILKKKIICMSVFMHSTNSATAPETVIELLAHLGLSIATTTIQQAVASLSKKAEVHIQAVGSTLTTMFAYDNLDITLPHATPTLENTHDSSISHMSTMTEIPLSHGVLPEHLDCVDKLEEILKNPEPVSMDQILAYLSEHGPAYFQKYKSDLGSPEEIDCIPPIKITQVPMQAADIQPNTSVQNAEVLANIFAQAGIRDPKDILGDRNNYKKKLLTNLGNKAVIIVGDLLTGRMFGKTKYNKSSSFAIPREFPTRAPSGFLFFGTITYAEESIWNLIEGPSWQKNPIQFLVVDLTLVAGVDMSASEAFVRVQRLLSAKGVTLVFCGFSADSAVGKSLRSVDVLGAEGVELFSTFNDAMERAWTENTYLRAWIRSHKNETSPTPLPFLTFFVSVEEYALRSEAKVAPEPLNTVTKTFSSYEDIDVQKFSDSADGTRAMETGR